MNYCLLSLASASLASSFSAALSCSVKAAETGQSCLRMASTIPGACALVTVKPQFFRTVARRRFFCACPRKSEVLNDEAAHDVKDVFVAGAGEPLEFIRQRCLIFGFAYPARFESISNACLGPKYVRVQPRVDEFQRCFTCMSFGHLLIDHCNECGELILG